MPDPVTGPEANALASAQCDYLDRCDPDAMFLFSDPSRTACEEYFACRAARFGAKSLASLDELSACIDSLELRECPDVLQRPTKRFSFDGSFPWGPACGEITLEDRLAPPPDAPSVGQACIRPRDERAICARGSFCKVEGPPVIGTYFCGTCERMRKVGEPCALPAARCIADARCLSGECRQIREVGESCESRDECRFHRCIDSVCFPSEDTPTPYADVVGRECEGDGDCGRQAALYCDEGICHPLPGEGEPCAGATMGTMGTMRETASINPFSFSKRACRLGHECIDGRCRALGCSIDPGEPCSSYCHGGRCVDGRCLRLPGAGEPCETSCGTGSGDRCEQRCAGDLRCVEGRCSAGRDRANGRRCDFDRDCVSGFCERRYVGRTHRSEPPCSECGVCADPPTVERCTRDGRGGVNFSNGG
jgi:hypothetical protein